MNAKELMKQIRSLDTSIDIKATEIDHLKAMLLKITPTLKDDPSFSGGFQDKLGEIMPKIVDLNNEINAEIDALVDKRDLILALLDQVEDPDQRNVLYKRYFEYKTWEQIAVEMNYTCRWIYKIHGNALQSINKILKDDMCSF
ncbi:DUF1492 domain-containing protein [Treponema sp.]|uniref:DUF1492 domain-containing protein n=1 Tax=Treponema sp. TaxID=166 RepID=UPI00388D557E